MSAGDQDYSGNRYIRPTAPIEDESPATRFARVQSVRMSKAINECVRARTECDDAESLYDALGEVLRVLRGEP